MSRYFLISKIASISTGIPPGSATMPTALRACARSLLLTAWTAGPLWLAGLAVPIDEDNFIRWALAGSVAAAILWLSGLRLLRHPLWREVEHLRDRLPSRALTRATGGDQPGSAS